MDFPAPTPLPERGEPTERMRQPVRQMLWQLLRFGLVGCLNTLIDVLVLNGLLWFWPAHNAATLVLYNSLAYALGALNSFILNRYWTFQKDGRPDLREVRRFALTTLAGIVCNDLILAALSSLLQTLHSGSPLWTNIAKLGAIGGTILISYLGMRLWVFARHSQGQLVLTEGGTRGQDQTTTMASAATQELTLPRFKRRLTSRSLSVVLPAYNEEQVIATTVCRAVDILSGWLDDFEVIVVNDGSADRTGEILAGLSAADERVRVVTHAQNQGYGATLVDGFAAASKELTFFMDSDGQFDIRDLEAFFRLLEQDDVIIGYRLHRQDTWMRRLNAWGWKMVVRVALGVHVRDIDCAFKLLPTAFLQDYPLETRGAMINAELLYKLKRAGYSMREVGVRHLPRQGGRATGAKLNVIARAFRELFIYTRKWRAEEAAFSALAAGPCQRSQRVVDFSGKETGTTMIVTDQAGGARPEKASSRPDEGFLPYLWQKLTLGAIMLVSIFMNFYQLGQNGFGNLFYAAGVRSMADGLRAFFFASYDPAGFVTIDKPPVGFWLQAISVKLFGFTPFSIFLPQALAGVLAVLVLFILVRRHFGVTAGLLAALALTLSPLSVATNRNNTIDSTLTLVLLLGAWAIMRAVETGRWRWLLLSALLVGLGFNVKMMEAYLVVPAFGLLYLLAAPRRVPMRLAQLAVAVIVLLTVSLSWAVVVDLIPASQRPYVGSSQDNSEVSLAFGYNGVDRLLGRFGLNGGHTETAVAERPTASGTRELMNAGSGNGGGAGMDQPMANHFGMGSGQPGPFRLFSASLGGQIAWLLPIALLGILALAWQRRPRFQKDRQQQALILWTTWVLTMGIFFSVANFFHTYYMTTFAPAICALFGIGLVVMWRDYCRPGWRGWLLPLAIFLTACEQIFIISNNPAWGTWLIPLIAVPCVVVALALLAARLSAHLESNARLLAPALALGIAALLLAPAIWAAVPALNNSDPSTPQAGPGELAVGGMSFGRTGNTSSPALIDYLESNQGKAKYLVATLNSMSADSIILATNKPVMAMGGFGGGDPILTQSKLATLVSQGTVRFFLLNNPARSSQPGQRAVMNWFGLGARQTPLTTWVTQHCASVPASTWQAATTSASERYARPATQLYDCASVK
jgi:4-amino-4-deoxy-L-arabinose transferase-like glycosyltransferase/putative flippase GtrA